MDFPDFYQSQKNRVDDALNRLLPEAGVSELVEAMRYSVLGGGKRIRGVLVLEAERSGLGGDSRTDGGELLAAVVELIHAYSLVHDDLPAMDDDDVRRGQPACHKAFGEDIAILAGNGLLNLAYRTLGELDEPDVRDRALKRISDAAGDEHLLEGQARDLKYETEKPEARDVLDMYTRKTGALLGLSLELGAISAGLPGDQQLLLRNIGIDLGAAFQIHDDLLEMEGGEGLGKSTDSDRRSEKWTYPRVVGETRARDRAQKLIDESLDRLEELDLDTHRLSELAEFLIERSY